MPKIVLDKTAYEPHPVTPERKRELNGQGFRIIDAVFAPPGTVIASVTKAIGEMSLPELKAYADLHKIDLAGATKKADILAVVEVAAALPDAPSTPIPEEWEAMTDDELIALAGALAGEPIVATGEAAPADKARSVIQATVEDRARKD